MSSRDLISLYDAWREATRAEGRAIENGSWAEVDAQQLFKDELKRRIVITTDEWQRLWPQTGETLGDYERQFRPIVAELISLETLNASLLAALREQTSQALAQIDLNSRNLRGVHRAYGSGAAAHWTSYS